MPIKREYQFPPEDFSTPLNNNHFLDKRVLKYKIKKDTGHDFVALEIVSKDNGCFEGRLKMGPLMDSSELSEQKFSVGNSNSGCAYIKTFHSLYLDVCRLPLVFSNILIFIVSLFSSISWLFLLILYRNGKDTLKRKIRFQRLTDAKFLMLTQILLIKPMVFFSSFPFSFLFRLSSSLCDFNTFRR